MDYSTLLVDKAAGNQGCGVSFFLRNIYYSHHHSDMSGIHRVRPRTVEKEIRKSPTTIIGYYDHPKSYLLHLLFFLFFGSLLLTTTVRYLNSGLKVNLSC